MDIAEIRKKAKKNQAGPQAQEQDTVKPESLEQEQEPIDSQNDSEVVATETVPTVADEQVALSNRQFSDEMDRLFAVSEDFSLATEESYANLLGDRADEQTRAHRQYLAFNLGDEEYALDITRISEIIKAREFTDIPRAPEYVLGIISLRGVVVPIFDLRRRLNLDKSELSPTSRIVVCQLDDITVGLLVDNINQVISLIDEELEPPPGVLAGVDREMITGIGRYQSRMIILLNLQSVMNVELN